MIVVQVEFNWMYWPHYQSNLRVSRIKIQNLGWQFGEGINFITFRKFVTSLIQQLKKKCIHKNCATRCWLLINLFSFFISFWTNDVTPFPKITWIILPPNWKWNAMDRMTAKTRSSHLFQLAMDALNFCQFKAANIKNVSMHPSNFLGCYEIES